MNSLLFGVLLQAFTVVDSIPHSAEHFTQGLFFHDSRLVETTGLYGKSGLYIYDSDFKIRDSLKLEEKYFGEGSAAIGNDIFYLTWRSKKAFRVNARSLKIEETFRIPTEGWGLTFCNGNLLLSDGSAELFTVYPKDFRYIKSLKISDSKGLVSNLNELECVDNFLYANIWQSDSIAIIDARNGQVLRYLDFSKKAREIREKHQRAEVLNGIAYDGRFLWLTGKWWPYIYKVKIKVKIETQN